MNIPHHEILNLLQQLAEHENIRVCVKHSLLIGGITGVSALFGGLLGGRPGAIAGALVGTAASGLLADDFVSVTHVIRNEMTDAQRKQLAQSAKKILMRLAGPATVTLSAILNNESVASSLLTLLRTTLTTMEYSVA